MRRGAVENWELGGAFMAQVGLGKKRKKNNHKFLVVGGAFSEPAGSE